jgi:hypothetical protein
MNRIRSGLAYVLVSLVITQAPPISTGDNLRTPDFGGYVGGQLKEAFDDHH